MTLLVTGGAGFRFLQVSDNGAWCERAGLRYGGERLGLGEG